MVIKEAYFVILLNKTTKHIICLWEVGGREHFCNRTLIVISDRYSYNQGVKKPIYGHLGC